MLCFNFFIILDLVYRLLFIRVNNMIAFLILGHDFKININNFYINFSHFY